MIEPLIILAAGVAAWLAGAVWYGLLGNKWVAALGTTKAAMARPPGLPSALPFILSFVADLVMAWVLAGIIGHLGPVTLRNGLISGALCWLGFVASTLAVNHSFQGANRSLTLIDGIHWLGVLLVQGAVIGLIGI